MQVLENLAGHSRTWALAGRLRTLVTLNQDEKVNGEVAFEDGKDTKSYPGKLVRCA